MLLTRNLITAALTVTILTAVSGCTGSRWLSRRDYSQLHDPFMEPSSTLAEAKGAPHGNPNSAGIARLGQTSAGDGRDVSEDTLMAERGTLESGSSVPGVVSLSGPKPIQRVSASDSSEAPGGVARAVYPDAGRTSATAAYPGPSLSDFMNSPEQPVVTSASSTPSSRIDVDFEQWASQRYRSLQSTTPVIPPANTRASTSGTPAGLPDFDETPAEVAEPLIRRSAVSSDVPETAGSPSSAGAGVNPFAAYEAELNNGSRDPQSSADTSHSGYEFESENGWKPRNFIRP